MTTSAELRSGKGSGDENFPVASVLVAPKHRAAVLAFYEFVRVADDIADHAQLPPAEKLARLDRMEASLLGTSDAEPEGVRLRDVLRARSLSPIHAQHLLRAFRQDVTKLRYDNWDDLIEYCRYSAMPVGRYVLDVHGESQSTWVANDALCAALQIINHLQDCAKDFRDLDRVYVPLDALAANALTVEALAAPRATLALMRCIRDLATRTGTLLEQSRPFALQIRDRRLAMEVAAIQSLAERLVGVLQTHDPLSERVHLSKPQMLLTGLSGALGAMSRRLFSRAPSSAFAR
ncbi:MAG TPA: squalene synthase HpnC [Pseudolabrys sp.]|uniref:squalene synthase HpnC n=1 Tax=Pseudolabrys sp. TaxID=1960880 RepID=UPI002DDCD178|nr:squalene synthase HpnC [Pseudolabrys sp.]HEV2628216.1 squalene synthase HpnC [Pseudolabrys sp.]